MNDPKLLITTDEYLLKSIKFLLDNYPVYFTKRISRTTNEMEMMWVDPPFVSSSQQVSANTWVRTGMFFFLNDLHTYVGAPLGVYNILPNLIEIYGSTIVSYELAQEFKVRNLLNVPRFMNSSKSEGRTHMEGFLYGGL